MNCPSKILTLVCVLALTAPPGVPQQQKPGPPAPQEQPQARIRIITNVVIVPVTVKDGDGHLVPDLRKEEFRVFEDNVEQKVDQFFNEPFPLSMAVLIDNDLPKGVAQEVESSLPAIVGGLSDQDEVFVCRFDLTFHPGKGFTRDPDKLLTELKRTTLQSSPSNVDTGGPLTSGPSINGRPANGPSPSPPNIILKGERGRCTANESARGILDVQLETGMPVANGVLTSDTEEQAPARAPAKGAEAARVAVEMANTLKAVAG